MKLNKLYKFNRILIEVIRHRISFIPIPKFMNNYSHNRVCVTYIIYINELYTFPLYIYIYLACRETQSIIFTKRCLQKVKHNIEI